MGVSLSSRPEVLLGERPEFPAMCGVEKSCIHKIIITFWHLYSNYFSTTVIVLYFNLLIPTAVYTGTLTSQK